MNYVVEPRPKVVGLLDYKSGYENTARVYSPEGIAPCLQVVSGGNTEPKIQESSYRIRKLTERECFRLMDVPEVYIDRIQAAGISRSQQYKMAGNSIVVSCMYHIWRKLWIDTEIKTLTLF